VRERKFFDRRSEREEVWYEVLSEEREVREVEVVESDGTGGEEEESRFPVSRDFALFGGGGKG